MAGTFLERNRLDESAPRLKPSRKGTSSSRPSFPRFPTN
jgi:hypothetical protein